MTIPIPSGSLMGVSYADVYTPPAAGAYNYGTSNPVFAVGTLSEGLDGSKWIYVKVGTGGITTGGFVAVYDEDFLAVMMSNSVGAIGDKIGVFGGSTSAIALDYCWLQVYGTCDQIQVAASAAANVALASTTTDGVLDDSVANPTKNISGMWLTTARAASQGVAPGVLNWPTVGATN